MNTFLAGFACGIPTGGVILAVAWLLLLRHFGGGPQ